MLAHLCLLEQVADAAGIPWTQLAGGGAAGLVALLFIYTMRHTSAAHEKCQTTFSETVKDSNKQFADTVKACTEKFGETTTTLLREGRESSERREEQLHQTLREIRPR